MTENHKKSTKNEANCKLCSFQTSTNKKLWDDIYNAHTNGKHKKRIKNSEILVQEVNNLKIETNQFKFLTFCESFTAKNELMRHRKFNHYKNVPVCIYFIKGECKFKDEICFYVHEVTVQQENN